MPLVWSCRDVHGVVRKSGTSLGHYFPDLSARWMVSIATLCEQMHATGIIHISCSLTCGQEDLAAHKKSHERLRRELSDFRAQAPEVDEIKEEVLKKIQDRNLLSSTFIAIATSGGLLGLLGTNFHVARKCECSLSRKIMASVGVSSKDFVSTIEKSTLDCVGFVACACFYLVLFDAIFSVPTEQQ